VGGKNSGRVRIILRDRADRAEIMHRITDLQIPDRGLLAGPLAPATGGVALSNSGRPRVGGGGGWAGGIPGDSQGGVFGWQTR